MQKRKVKVSIARLLAMRIVNFLVSTPKYLNMTEKKDSDLYYEYYY